MKKTNIIKKYDSNAPSSPEDRPITQKDSSPTNKEGTILNEPEENKIGYKEEKQESIDFPLHALPDKIQEIISETKRCSNYPIEYTALSMLFVNSVAIGNSHVLRFKGDQTHSAVIYAALVGDSGIGKTHPLNFALNPLYKIDKRRLKDFKDKKIEYNKINALTKKERKESGQELPFRPKYLQTIVRDSTPEALADIHEFNMRGLGIYSDELNTWLQNFNRYNKGSEAQFWLQNWSNVGVAINRKGGDPIVIDDPFISVIGGIQNEVLASLYGTDMASNGFLYRFLFAAPKNLKVEYDSYDNIDPKYKYQWNEIIENTMAHPHFKKHSRDIEPTILKFDPDGEKRVYQWRRKMVDLRNKNSQIVKSVVAKIEIYQLRFALNIEVLEGSCNGTSPRSISLKSAERSIILAEHYLDAALRISDMSLSITDFSIGKLALDKLELYNSLPNLFKLKDGTMVANDLEINERTFRRFIMDKNLFDRVSYGVYKKK